MRKTTNCYSGLFTLRAAVACALFGFAVLLGTFSFISYATPSPTGGTLSTSSGPLAFTDTSPLVPNATGEGVGFSAPTCTVPNTCSSYTLTLGPSLFTAVSGYDPTKNNIVIQISWPTPANQYGSFVEDKNGNVIASNTAGLDPETITIPVVTANLQANGPYTIVTTAEIGGGQTLAGTVSLVPSSGAGNVSASPAPRYQVYEAPSNTATQSGEPSIGVDWNPNVPSLKQVAPGTSARGPTLMNTGGVTMYTSTFQQLRVDFDDCSSPALMAWTDTAFPTETLTTSDAIGFTDHFTKAALGTGPYNPGPGPAPNGFVTPGRTFHAQLSGGDSITAYTDDDGATHVQSQGGGIPQGPDHETIGAGPYAPTNTSAIPPVIEPPHPLYPNAVYYCTQNIAPEAECSRSDDGGQTFGPSLPIYNLQQCSGSIHGHVKVARDGTVYVPNYSCVLPTGSQGVAVSSDNGITWTERNVPGSGEPKPGLVDPSVAIGLNDVGKAPGQTANRIYLGYVDNDGTPKIAVSGDHGQTWSAPQNVGAPFGIVNSTFPAVVAGDDNRAAFGFLGTTSPGDSSLDPNFNGIWHLYIATTYDGGNSWVTIDTTPNDPVQIGGICNAGTTTCLTAGTLRNLLDFNGFDVDAQGRGLFGLSDGCINCGNDAATYKGQSNAAQGMIVRQSGGPRLFKAFDPIEPAAPATPQAVSAVEGDSGVTISWLEPDNGGSPITAYKIYRGISSGGETLLATVANDPLHTQTKYLDTTTSPTQPTYFYHVTAVNHFNGVDHESGFCEELSIGVGCTTGTGNRCAPPYFTVDCAGGFAGSFTSDPSTGELTIQNVSIGEPFTSCSDNSLTFVMRVLTLDPSGTGTVALFPSAEWQIIFNIVDTNGNPRTVYLDMNTIPPNGTPTVPSTAYGRRDPRTGGGTIDTGECTNSPTSTCAILSATATKDGAITFKLNTSGIVHFGAANSLAIDTTPFDWDARNPGTILSAVAANTYQFVGAGAGLLETVQTTGVGANYVRAGNVPCSGLHPVAKLTGSPVTGNAPLTVNFDASGSTEPTGACGTINSYTLDFGDGSAPVTQPTPNFSHTYNNSGDYPARLTVQDTAGQVSTNPAEVVVTVTSPKPDLIISALTASNNQAPQGSKVTLTATIKNQGNATAGASQTQFLLDGKTQIALVNTASLAPGASVKKSITWFTASVPKGLHTITAIADKSNQVTESDETNNTKSITISIQGNKT
jgi:PKD repeat protein